MSFTMNINMPNFITKSDSGSKRTGSESTNREAFICKCRDCSTSANGKEFPNFSEIENHLKTLNMTFFNCPIYGCTHRLPMHSATITTY